MTHVRIWTDGAALLWLPPGLDTVEITVAGGLDYALDPQPDCVTFAHVAGSALIAA